MNRVTRVRQLAAATGDEQAQGLIEFALLITVLFFIFLGTVDYARFLYYDSALSGAARVGAETATNHCPIGSSACAITTTVTSDSFVLWETSCEASGYLSLKPSYSSCSGGSSTSWTPTCSGTCTNCSQDICVSPSARSSGTQVTVTAGYSFKPLTVLMSGFFPDKSCFTGDSTSANHHTLCASSTGRVF